MLSNHCLIEKSELIALMIFYVAKAYVRRTSVRIAFGVTRSVSNVNNRT